MKRHWELDELIDHFTLLPNELSEIGKKTGEGDNMQKGNLIGMGNTAEVYEWGREEILKLFYKDFPKQGIEREFRVSKEVYECGLRVPKVGQLIEYEDRIGITFERIDGEPMLKRISQRFWTVNQKGKRLAELHYKIHQTTIQSVPSLKKSLERIIRKEALLSDKTKQSILALLTQLPDKNALCHGDFHPENVIINFKKAIIHDWMTATYGDPAADVARTIFLLKSAMLPPNIPLPIRLLISFMRSHLCSAYRERYLELSRISMEEIQKWELPIVAARLTERIPKAEKEMLLRRINAIV